MELPFPGMDPYLEATSLWPDVHSRLAVVICEQLQPLLSPRYIAVLTPYTAIEIRSLLERPITYYTVEVRTVAGDTLVTAIEVLSPRRTSGLG